METARTGVLERTESLSRRSVFDDNPLRLYDACKFTVANAAEKDKIEVVKISSSEPSYTDYRPSTLVPRFLAPFLPQNPATQQGREPAENAQCKLLDPLIQVSITASVPHKSHVSEDSDKGKHQTEVQGDHRVTKNHVLKLSIGT